MPAPRKRPVPSARMVELLADEKRLLLDSGFRFDIPDDRTLTLAAVALDERRSKLRHSLDRLRERGASTVEMRDLRDELAEADRNFADLLERLPAMAAFERAWDRCWQVMVRQRAWPHATAHRRAWRSAMLDCKPETRACFLGEPTGFQRYVGSIAEAMDDSRFAEENAVAGTLVA